MNRFQRARRVALLSQMSATIFGAMLNNRNKSGCPDLAWDLQSLRGQAIDQAFKMLEEVGDLHEKNHPDQSWVMGL